jgi:hypothetical protein
MARSGMPSREAVVAAPLRAQGVSILMMPPCKCLTFGRDKKTRLRAQHEPRYRRKCQGQRRYLDAPASDGGASRR